MFDKVVLRRAHDGPGYSLGQVAEALLYYQHVHLIFDWGTLGSLLRQISGDELLVLLKRPGVTCTYFDQTLGTRAQRLGAIEHYDFMGMMLVGTPEGRKIRTVEDLIREALIRAGNDKTAAAKLAGKLRQHVRPLELLGPTLAPGGVAKAATADVFDIPYLNSAMREWCMLVPGWPTDREPRLEVFKTELGFHAIGNIDFDDVNRRRSQAGDTQPVTMATFLNTVFLARADLSVAAHYGGDFHTSFPVSRLVQLRAKELMTRTNIDARQIAIFEEVIYDGARSLSEVIDSGERSFSELMTLLDRSALFKHWMAKQHADSGLTKEYFAEANKEGWLSSLPAKAVRYVLGTALSLKLPMASNLFAVADAFLLDKMAKGWRPNHFVEKRLKPFNGTTS